MSGIHKVPKRGQKIKNEPRVLGAKPISNVREQPKVLDQRTKMRPVEIQTKTHGESVTVRSHTRSKPLRKDEPDVRLRAMTPEEREEWNRVRNLEWEDE